MPRGPREGAPTRAQPVCLVDTCSMIFFRIVHLHHKQFAVKRREPSGPLTKPERNRAFRTLVDETRTQSEV